MANEVYEPAVETRLRADMQEIISRYPVPRSALLPMLHLVQSEDGYVSARGISLCAEVLGLTKADVSAVATFYSQYRRRPGGKHQLSVCINPLCAVMGGDILLDTLKEHLGIEEGETTADGTITLQGIECNAACDYAPVVMVNWEFFDNQTPKSVQQLADDLQAGNPVRPTRGPDVLPTFQENERLLAGFEDGHVNEGPGAGEATLRGLKIAREKGWTSPVQDNHAGQEETGESQPETAAENGTEEGAK